jgi:hypothetical protein
MTKDLESMVKSDPYKSGGERIIGGILDKYSIEFDYEKQILVEDKKPNDAEKKRLWYPDFYLEDKGIIITYLGKPDDPNYMEGARRTKETYEKMGFKVIQVTLYNVFKKSFFGNKYHPRKGFEEHLLKAIDYAEKHGESVRLTKKGLETNAVEGYKYKPAA